MGTSVRPVSPWMNNHNAKGALMPIPMPNTPPAVAANVSSLSRVPQYLTRLVTPSRSNPAYHTGGYKMATDTFRAMASITL